MKFTHLLIALLLLTACAPTLTIAPPSRALLAPLATPSATATATVTLAPTATPTHPPTAQLKIATGLYSGPSNLGYETLGQLEQNAQVITLATFGDFVQVQTAISGTVKTGFILKDAVGDLPNDLIELDVDQVPWMSVLDGLKLAGWHIPSVSVSDGQIIHSSTPTGWSTIADTRDSVAISDRFAVRLLFSGEGQGYGVLLFGALNDNAPWWKDIRRLDVDVSSGDLALLFYDGTSDKPQYFKLPPSLRDQPLTMLFDQQGKRITVLDSAGRVAADLTLGASLFPSQRLYFGVNAGMGGTLHLSQLQVLMPPAGKVLTALPSILLTPASSLGLRALADQRGFEFGSLVNWWRPADPKYRETVLNNYNLYQSSDFLWRNLQPDAQHYDFNSPDRAVAWATANKMRVQAHHLIWGFVYALPYWLTSGNYTRAQLLQLMHDHITTVVGRFKGRANEWSVVNEPLTNDQFWGQHVGPDYIEMAFRWAHEADPSAVLILNQDSDEDHRNTYTQSVSDHLYTLVSDLKQKGVPIDGIGMEMHLRVDDAPKKADVIENMQRFGALGVKVYITELDVDLAGASGTTQEKYARQAQVYADMLAACLESQVCPSFTMHGFRDADSWLLDPALQKVMGVHGEAPLIFDDNYNPKPAYFALHDVLASQ